MGDQSFTVSEYGTNQQEAVGMGAVYDPRFEGVAVNASMIAPDTGAGVDFIASLLASIFTGDIGAGDDIASINAILMIYEGTQTTMEAVGMGSVYDPARDTGHGEDVLLVNASVPVSEAASGADSATINASVSASDTGSGLDFISPAKAYFFVTSEGVLNPLGVVVLRDSRQDLLPGTRENTDTVPGRHGEIDFGSEFNFRLLELHVATDGEVSKTEREQLKRTIAKWLNPIIGPQNLIFADDVEKTYRVKYAGRIDLSRMLTNWLEFTIPFKASDPFIVGSFEKAHVGGGTLTNEGTFETPVKIEINGPVVDPSVTVGGEVLSWTGAVGASDKLIIDTEYMTVKFNGVNAIANYNGGFPKLQPGDTTVTAASSGTTAWIWRDRWI